MKTSETIAKIAVALLEAQKGITFASKDATNPHFKNRYADLPAVVDAVKPALNDAGIAFIQSAGPSDDSKLHLTTRLIHTSGEWIEDTLVMPLPKQDPQGYGSAMTYARRYALAAITGLYQDDDDGNAGSGVGPKTQAPVKKGLTTHEMTDLKVALREADTLPDLKRIGDEAYDKMTEEQRGEIAATYKKRKKEIEEGATA
jgi:ERF superfamily protein